MPFEVLLFNLVKLGFHMPREGDIHYFGEVFVELVGDNLADIGGEELFVLLLDVLSILYSADDGGVCARAADAFLFQGLYERAFRIACGWLCEMLLGLYIHDGQFLAELGGR